MKKLARVIGILGGIAAILWAMRDRLVSIAAPREPEPPKFRVVPPLAEPETGDDLTQLTGIGPVFAARLKAEGIDTFAKLTEAGAETVAGAAGVPASRASEWIAQASALV